MVSTLLCACRVGKNRRILRHRIPVKRKPYKDAKEPSQLLSPLQCTGQRHLINKLQMPANRNTIRQPRNLDAERLQQPRNVHRRGFALGVRDWWRG